MVVKYQKVRWNKPVRMRYIKDQKIPAVARNLLLSYGNSCADAGTKSIHFSVFNLPKSVNHMYGRRSFKGKVITYPTKALQEFKLLVKEAMGRERFDWNPTGPLAVVILFESHLWVTKENKVRQMDADNRVKGLLDAIDEATEAPDELYWQIHVFKIASSRPKTTVWIFDLGEIVEFYS